MQTHANEAASSVSKTTAGLEALVSGKKILRRWEQLRAARQPLENVIRECYDVSYPLRGVGFHIGPTNSSSGYATTAQSLAARKQEDLYDDTCTRSARILASALVSGSVPANSRWGESEVDDATPGEKSWLDEKSTLVWKWIHKSNFDSVIFECMLDQVIAGLFYLFVDEDKEAGGYAFEEWSLAETWCASSKKGGKLDTFFRLMSMSAEQAVREFGADKVDARVVEASVNTPDLKFDYVHAIFPRPGGSIHARLSRNLPFASVITEVLSERSIVEKGYHEQPIIAPRWQVLPKSAYTIGPVFEALPTVNQLLEVIRLNMGGLEMNIGGMWIAKDDGVLNPHSIKVGPKKIIVAASTDAMKSLIHEADMSKVLISIENLQRQIKGSMMADHLEPLEANRGQPETAFAASVRVSTIRQLLGPTFGRMMSEMLPGLWERCWGLAFRSGTLGQPPESLRGRVYGAKYNNPFAQAQRATEVQAMDEFEQALGMESEVAPEVLDVYNFVKAARRRAELKGVPLDLLNTPEEIAASQKAEQDAIQAQKSEAMQEQLTLESAKKDGGDANQAAMMAIAQAMNRPREFTKKGRVITGIQ